MSLPNLLFGKTGLSSPSVVSVSGASTITITIADAFNTASDIDLARGVLVCEWALPDNSYTLMRLRNNSGTTINQEWMTAYEGTSTETSSSIGVTGAYRFAAKHRSFLSGHSNFDGYRNKAIIYLKNPNANHVVSSTSFFNNHNYFNMEIHYMATNLNWWGNFEDMALAYSKATSDTSTSSGKVVDIQFFAQTSGFNSQSFSSFHARYYPLFTRIYPSYNWQ